MSTCHLDMKTKAQFNKLFPMLQTLGVDVLKTKDKIIVSIFNKIYNGRLDKVFSNFLIIHEVFRKS